MPEITDEEYWKLVGINPGPVRPLVEHRPAAPGPKPPPLIFGDRIIEASSFGPSGPWEKVSPDPTPDEGNRSPESAPSHHPNR